MSHSDNDFQLDFACSISFAILKRWCRANPTVVLRNMRNET